MRKLVKLFIINIVYILLYIEFLFHKELVFSIGDVIIREVYNIEIIENVNFYFSYTLIFISPVSLVFLLSEKKKIELISLIILLGLLIIFLPWVNLYGVKRSF